MPSEGYRTGLATTFTLDVVFEPGAFDAHRRLGNATLQEQARETARREAAFCGTGVPADPDLELLEHLETRHGARSCWGALDCRDCRALRLLSNGAGECFVLTRRDLDRARTLAGS